MQFTDSGELSNRSTLLDRALQPPDGSPELATLVDELITWQETNSGRRPITIAHAAHDLPPAYIGEGTVAAEARLHQGFRRLVAVGVLAVLEQKAYAGGGDYYPQYLFVETG